jgi:hypothetical protein
MLRFIVDAAATKLGAHRRNGSSVLQIHAQGAKLVE